MSKIIASTTKLSMGHLRLTFTDGTSEIIVRGGHELLGITPGDSWPPDRIAPVAKATVTSVAPRTDGHHDVTMDNGKKILVERGDPVPRVGEEYFHRPAASQLPSSRDLDIIDLQKQNQFLASENAKLRELLGGALAFQPGHVEIQEGQLALGKQEGTESNESETSGSNHAIGKTGFEA